MNFTPQRKPFGLGLPSALAVGLGGALTLGLVTSGELRAASALKSVQQQATEPKTGEQKATVVPAPAQLELPTHPSPSPSAADWRKAELIEPTRAIGERARSCEIRRIREWLSIRCPGTTISAITQLGGTQKGASFHLDRPDADRMPKGGVVLFPLRPGDRRVLSLWTLGPGYDGPFTIIAGVIIQADRVADHPTLLLHDALHEPVRTAQSLKRQTERP